MTTQQFSLLEHLNKRFKCGLEVNGAKVTLNGSIVHPWQVESIYKELLEKAIPEVLEKLVLDHYEKLSLESPQRHLQGPANVDV